MEKFTPYEKRSKKQKKADNLKKRATWKGFNPITRKSANAKGYNRQKAQKWKNESPFSVFLFFFQNRLNPAHHILFLQHDFDTMRMCGAVRQNPLYMPPGSFPCGLVFFQYDIHQCANFNIASFLSIHFTCSFSCFKSIPAFAACIC